MTIHLPFHDRVEAGRALAARLQPWRAVDGLLVLGLPRGGVPVAFQIAQALGAELDILLVRKLGSPGNPELAMGAIASGGIRVMNPEVVLWAGIDDRAIERVVEREEEELERRARLYRGRRPMPVIAGRRIILVDDGMATGATMRAALATLRSQDPAELVVAVPVAPSDTVSSLGREADAVVCLGTPDPFGAIARFYVEFPQVSDEEVIAALARAWEGPRVQAATAHA